MENENPTSSQQSQENLSKSALPDSKKTTKNERFQLNFKVKEQIGRSRIKIGKPLTVANTVAPKFYVRDPLKNSNLDEQLQRLNVTGPREKYKFPITENQRYGWYQEKLINTDKSDRRLHFAKHTDELIKEYLQTQERIRDYILY